MEEMQNDECRMRNKNKDRRLSRHVSGSSAYLRQRLGRNPCPHSAFIIHHSAFLQTPSFTKSYWTSEASQRNRLQNLAYSLQLVQSLRALPAQDDSGGVTWFEPAASLWHNGCVSRGRLVQSNRNWNASADEQLYCPQGKACGTQAG